MEDAFTIIDDMRTVRKLEEITETKVGYVSQNKISKNGTRHEALMPVGMKYTEIPQTFSKFTAKEYNFELDLFQKMSLHCLENDESVIVAAHTSSGKTVVAEYAIALSFKSNQRVIYTSPIKALSNQKFRELQDEFKDVGLMTGDVTINPGASCLVMTTEILRNMLYRGSEILREVHWVIFDEIHYMRDKERGVVWEETLILLKNVKMVFLSATIPNAAEFAGWVAVNHNMIVHVIYTDMRPTPLTHYVGCTHGLVKVKEKEFDERSFQTAMNYISKKSNRHDDTPLKNIISILVENNNLPAIVFSFSRKDCEKYAVTIVNDFLTEDEKEKVETIFSNALLNLREEDRNLCLIKHIKPLLLRGIGIHHSGLLPIIKEIIEILFQENLIRILFATETFSIGLNMPCKTVVFTSLKKFDGDCRRLVTSGEYIQMSGRAGRRGIDKTGVVICMTEQITTMEAREIFKNNSDVLNSAFYLSYNMILNLKRVEGLDPLYLLSRSFYHIQAQNRRIGISKDLVLMYKEIKPQIAEDEKAKAIFELYKERLKLKKERSIILAQKADTYISKGTMVDIFVQDELNSYFIGNVFVHSINDRVGTIDCFYFVDGGITKKTFFISQVDKVYRTNLKLDTKIFFRKFEAYDFSTDLDQKIAKIEEEIEKSDYFIPFDRCFFCLNASKSCLTLCKYIDAFKRAFDKNSEGLYDENEHKDSYFKILKNEKVNGVVTLFRKEAQSLIYEGKVKEYKKLNEIYHMDECQRMVRVLNRLGYCDDKSVLSKGKIACEISQGDELVLTEIIFNGDFSKMNVDDVVALLSCFVFEEWQSESVGISEKSQAHYKIILDTADKINEILKEYGLSKENYADKFSYELMDVVRMWSAGHTFFEICQKTSVFEGSIIRVLKRLEELLRQLTNAARVIGNTELENLFAIAITKIKRDIVFVASLYL